MVSEVFGPGASIGYSPAIGDGFSGTDGAISASTTAFTSASASFTSDDVGKPISIREAGSAYFVSAATLNSGGASHAVGDLVTMQGGLQIYVREVSAGAIVTFYVVSSDSSGTNPATRSQSATTGSGTGAVVNVTWLRKNLVTTIASVQSATACTLALAASATVSAKLWGYGTDYGAEIQAALDAAIPVHLPSGIVVHTNKLTFNDRAVLLGTGMGLSFGQSPCVLLYAGPHDTTGAQLSCDSDLNPGGLRISGAHIGNFELAGLGSLGIGLKTSGLSLSQIKPLKVLDHITVGVQILATATQDNSLINYEQLRISEGITNLNTHGMWVGFPNTVDLGRDPDASTFGHVSISVNTAGVGVPCIWGGCDHIQIFYMRLRGNSTVPGVDHLGGNWALAHGRAQELHYFTLDAGEGGGYSRAIGYNVGARVIIDDYDLANGQPNYVSEIGTTTDIRDSIGRRDWVKYKLNTFAGLPTPAEGMVAYITDSPVTDVGLEVTVGGGTSNVLLIYRNSTWVIMPSHSIQNLVHLKATAFANLGTYTAGSLALINDSPSGSWGTVITTGGGTDTVLAISSSPTAWRIVGVLQGTSVKAAPVMFGSPSLAGNTTTYLIPGTSATATINDASQITSVKGTLKAFRFRALNTPGVGESYIATLNYGLNGAIAATSVTCTVSGSGGATTCSDIVNSQAVVSGGVWNVSVVTSAGAAATGPVSVSLEYDVEI